MTLPRYAVRVDRSAAAIVEVLRAAGFHVELLKVPCDVLCSRHGHWHCVELKTGQAGKLTPAQERFKDRARAPLVVLRDVDAALVWVKAVP
jgi:hypothetical protein